MLQSAEAVAEAMVGTSSNAGLRRKARIGRDDHDARAMSAGRALRLALEKAADEDLAMALSVRSLERSAPDQAGLLNLVADDMLLLLLEGPNGARGVATLDGGVVASLIEAQTTGQILPRVPVARKMTRTDAAMAAPLVDGVLSRATGHLADHPDGQWAGGYCYGAMIDDVRGLGLALSSPDFHVFRMSLDIGQGVRMGEMMVALPCPSVPVLHVAAVDQAVAAQRFQARVMDAPVRLDAVLCRMTLPLSQVSRVKVGDLLPLSVDMARDISIEAVGRRSIATARLGKMDGLRAIRLNLQTQALGGLSEMEAGGAPKAKGSIETTGAKEENGAPMERQSGKAAHPGRLSLPDEALSGGDLGGAVSQDAEERVLRELVEFGQDSGPAAA